jgi:uncharacterized protein DUF4261
MPPSPPDGFAHAYSIELLCESSPSITKPDLLRSLQQRCPGASPLDGTPESGLLAFIHPDHLVQYENGALPAQTLIALSDKPFDPALLQPAVQQSWSFPEAASVLQRCTAAVLVTDIMASGLEYRERLSLFQQVVRAVLDVVPCLAIHWTPTQQILDPAEYLRSLADPAYPDFFAGGVNVRFFRISSPGQEGDMLMDTLGLAALGLPDLQCHFRLLDPNDVSNLLYNTAFYLYENGDVVEDGHTIAGIPSTEKWRCQHEESLVPPERVVLDLNPGYPFAAGTRAEG